MQVDPPTKANTPTGAVFLSYASQDAGAAQRICEGLRAAGIEVWFDQSELRGGDAWDHKIRDQIQGCRLFIAIISANTERRDEGYFRREWSLAVDRTRDMLHKRTFLVPVVIDGTSERGAAVPEKFHELQWTRLRNGEAPPAFVDRIRQLLMPDAALAATAAAPSTSAPPSASSAHRLWLSKAAIWGASAIAGVACGYFVLDKLWLSNHMIETARPALPTSRQTSGSADAATAFNPSPDSIAVLPFVNMSGDAKQEYFSDGLTEELLNSLARFPELQVSARTSAFSFKGKDIDVATIAHRLNVGTVLEGSVRRSTNTVRVTVQLVDATTGFHLWSQTYDRRLGDVLQLQTDIATSVANALKITLLADAAGTVGLGATANPAAFDVYLRGRTSARTGLTEEQDRAADSAYAEAIRLDPHYAQAFAERSINASNYAEWHARGLEVHEWFTKALSDAEEAVRLAPRLAEGHYALATALKRGFQDFARANAEYRQARDLGPGNARMQAAFSRNAAELGDTAATIDAARRAVTLDPLNFTVHRTVGIAFLMVRRYADAVQAFQTALSLHPDDVRLRALMGETRYEMGDLQAARASCEMSSADQVGQLCLALTYYRMGLPSEAKAMLRKLESSRGDSGAYDFATIYAQWGDVPKALDWLEMALRMRDPNLSELKTEPDLDPLRKEPRFQAIEQALKFPN